MNLNWETAKNFAWILAELNEVQRLLLGIDNMVNIISNFENIQKKKIII